MAIATVIPGVTVWSGCCDPCTTSDSEPCDTCYCQELGILDPGPGSNWCCSDRLTKPCVPDTTRGCPHESSSLYDNTFDIRIDKLEMKRVGANVETEIFISSNGYDNAPCAKLEILLPVAATFIALNNLGIGDITWEFYGGYLRVNLEYVTSMVGGDNPDESDVFWSVNVVTSIPCEDATVTNSGIAAFVYSIAPDPCLKNNYAYGYYQIHSLGSCITPMVTPLVKEPKRKK